MLWNIMHSLMLVVDNINKVHVAIMTEIFPDKWTWSNHETKKAVAMQQPFLKEL